MTSSLRWTPGKRCPTGPGGGVQVSSFKRWGDYSSMTVDPRDDCTFWYTNEYYIGTGSFNWATRVGAFKFDSCRPGN